jgi:hypothetical protein
MPRRPPTTLPPILSRSKQYKRGDGITYDGQELYEDAVSMAIEIMEGHENGSDGDSASSGKMEKVVLYNFNVEIEIVEYSGCAWG